MKLKYLILLLGILFLTSCHQRQELSYTENTNTEVALSFSSGFTDFSPNTTRAYPTDPIEIQKNRVNFKGLRIVLYTVSPTDPTVPEQVAYAFDLDINAEKGTFTGTDLETPDNAENFTFKTKGIAKVAPNDYLVYLFTTPTQSLKQATEVGQPFTALSNPMTFDKEDFQYNKLLTNHYLTATPTKVSKTLFSSNTPDQTYTIPTSMLTALNAMLSVKWQATIKDTKYQLLDDALYFYPDVQNLKYTLFPTYDTTLQQSKNLKYPINANYSGFSSKQVNELTSEFLYRSNLEKPLLTSYTPSTSKVNTYRPIPENTSAGKERGIQVITRAIILVKIMPKSLKATLTPDKLASTSLSWVLWNKRAYTGEDFLSRYNTAKAKSTKTAEDQRLITDGDKVIKNGQFIEEGYEDHQIKYFHHCYAYYAVPIIHFTKEQLGGTIEHGGYYGVVRNHHYQLDIRSIGTLGKASYKALPQQGKYDLSGNLSTNITVKDMNEIINIIDTLE